MVGTTKRGKERVLGEISESFELTPAEPIYRSSFKLFPEEYFHRNAFTGLRLDLQVGGVSYGPSGLSYDDPASFIKVPILRR